VNQSTGAALALPAILVSMALVPLLPSSSQVVDSDPCRGPSLFILCTTFPHVPQAGVPYLASSSSFPGRDSEVVRGSIELPIPDPILVFHATSLPFPMLFPGLKASIVIAPSSGVVSKMPQTTHDYTHPSVSY